MLLYDLLNIFSGNSRIESSVGVNDNDRTKSAKAETSGLSALDLFGKAVSYESLVKCLLNGLGARRSTAGTATNQYVCTNHYKNLLSLTYLIVYSSMTLPPLRCFSMTSAAFSGVILT